MTKPVSTLKTRVMTPKFRVSFPAVFEPKLNTLNGKNEYSVVMMFDKNDKTVMAGLSELYDVATSVAVEKFGENLPANLRMPFRDGDADRPEYYKGYVWVTSRSTIRPGVVDQQCTLVTPDSPEFYAGCYCKATVQLFAYDAMGNKGVSMGLQNLQIVGRGEAFTMRKDAVDDFTPVTDEEQPTGSIGDLGGAAPAAAKPNLFGNRGPAPAAAPATPKGTAAGKKMFG